MATLSNKRKLAAVARETQDHPRNSQSQNTSVLGITEQYITQVSEEIEDRVTRKLSQEFNKTESHILGALSNLDVIFLNPQPWTFSGAVLGTCQSNDAENRVPARDRSRMFPIPNRTSLPVVQQLN